MKIFFIGPLQSSFVKNDIKILEKSHKLTFENAAIGRGLAGIINLIMLSYRSIWKTIRSDSVFCWFADYTTLLPTIIAKMTGKKVFVIAGGFDVTNLPKINCGAYLRPFRWFCVKNTFRFATKIFPVSNYAMKQLKSLTNSKFRNAEVIYNCIDIEKFDGTNFDSPRDIVLTVSQGDTYSEYIRKGSHIFIALAQSVPSKKFVLAGLRGEALKLALESGKDIDNLEILEGPLSLYGEIVPLYRRAAAYCQFSIEETFGVAVLEAMICGAMPIVSSGGALPEITKGSKGVVAESMNEIQNAMNKSFALTPRERRSMANFVNNYDISIREKLLLNGIKI